MRSKNRNQNRSRSRTRLPAPRPRRSRRRARSDGLTYDTLSPEAVRRPHAAEGDVEAVLAALPEASGPGAGDSVALLRFMLEREAAARRSLPQLESPDGRGIVQFQYVDGRFAAVAIGGVPVDELVEAGVLA